MPNKIKHMDFVKKGDTVYLITRGESGLTLWDFRAWLKGYYDAYITLSEFKEGELTVIGNLYDNPELLPKECEGYNGEPHVQKIADIWINPNLYHDEERVGRGGNIIIACAGGCGKTTEGVNPYEFWRGEVKQEEGNLVPL